MRRLLPDSFLATLLFVHFEFLTLSALVVVSLSPAHGVFRQQARCSWAVARMTRLPVQSLDLGRALLRTLFVLL